MPHKLGTGLQSRVNTYALLHCVTSYCFDCSTSNSVHTSDYNAVETTKRQNEVFSYFHCQSTTQEKEQIPGEDVCSDSFGFCFVLATFYRFSVSPSFLLEFYPTL